MAKMICYNCEHCDKHAVVHGYGTCELQDADFPIDHICNIVCERCFNSHFVISENGLKAVCCLSAKKAMKCIATHDYFCAKPMFVVHKNSMITETS